MLKVNNTALTTVDDRLIILMKEELNTEEQQHFVNNFIIYLKYGYDETSFVIDFDNVWKWVGFTRKGNAKTLLTKKFKENIDFVYDSTSATAEALLISNINKLNSSADNKETILLTVNTFKKFCMVASTDRANDICNYYIKMEKIMFRYTNEKLVEIQNKLNEFIEYDEELFWNENQINDFDNKNVLYLALIGIYNNERIYKFGKTEQIFTRDCKQHQKFFVTFKMRFVIECDNMSFVEKEFKKFLKSIGLLRSIEIKENNITELFTIREKQNIDFIIHNLIKLVDENPLPAVKLLQDKVKQKDEELKQIKEYLKNINLEEDYNEKKIY
jgi:phage anti-repressor protein